jgi:L-threonylcarbamoyladenylate synthase
MSAELGPALEALRRGGVVACPTETFVGLLADALDPRAVDAVAALKGRPEGLPMALLVPSIEAIDAVAEPLGEEALALAERYFPGPLTLVVRARAGLSPWLVRDGTVGLRVPGPSPALDLVRAFGGPLTATSANLSGEPAVRHVRELAPELRAGVAASIQGDAPGGLPSTIVDVTHYPMRVLRPGALSATELGLAEPLGRGQIPRR